MIVSGDECSYKIKHFISYLAHMIGTTKSLQIIAFTDRQKIHKVGEEYLLPFHNNTLVRESCYKDMENKTGKPKTKYIITNRLRITIDSVHLSAKINHTQ